MGQLIDGKSIAKKIEERTAERVALLKEKGIALKLAVILVGADKPSQTYVRRKGDAAKRVGIDFTLHNFSADISMEDLIKATMDIQNQKDLSGLIIQLPLPEPLYTTRVLNVIKPEVDVDCLTDVNLGKLVMRTNFLTPPTPGAVITILKELKVDLVGKNVTIIGAGALVGKPLAIMMMNERATVAVCNSASRDIKERCLSSDVIVTGVGRKDIVRGDMVSPGAIVIDTGISFENQKMYGDVNAEEVLEKASYVTPTPGGVGPITVANLLWNTLLSAEKMFL
ncbi:MAG: Bifunctional protein FolD [Candidatus Magasanikbacteria bacterium GW2011_GWA2_46_17]|uniref:Bifunctional protein FolD n=1 Tax=Candidatus Magasanikbacteria bacterium GW2011_GWA2_46_17 TaxID=1619042 RepID=A0A0G1P092_9BACT|nr:MAG: Bifunctional protein FolD [Candidatus Magasanikbacteria bacterium GW2011_GWA2_46_17]